MFAKRLPKILLRGQARRWSSSLQATRTKDRFSILTSGNVSKKDVLDRIDAREWPEEPEPLHGDIGAAILVSRDLSGWLDDTAFMSALLQRLRIGYVDGVGAEAATQELSVLTAAVDGLSPLSPYGTPSGGVSIVTGDLRRLLPGLWDREHSHERSHACPSDTTQPSISMYLNPLLGDFRPVDVTLPLANTMFQNGKPHTLLASRWRRDGAQDSSLSLSHLAEKATQRITPSHESIQAHAGASAHLFPVTPPRKIVAGLGNIVRQVEVMDGASSQSEGSSRPASEELEVNIQSLINARSKLFPDDVTPIRTWALVIPERVASLDFLESLLVCVEDSTHVESEHDRSEVFARHFSKILADGSRLHRVLSGGGGWGLKKGLLSLDPQTTYSAAGAQDLESFIASFGGTQTSDSIVTPGSYVQFLVEPLTTLTQRGSRSGVQLPSLLLGTAPDSEMDYYYGGSSALSTPSLEIAEGHFGALSSQGVFINMTPEAESAEVHGTSTTHTKIDSPHSYIWEGSSRWL